MVIWSNVSMVWVRSNEGIAESFYRFGLVSSWTTQVYRKVKVLPWTRNEYGAIASEAFVPQRSDTVVFASHRTSSHHNISLGQRQP